MPLRDLTIQFSHAPLVASSEADSRAARGTALLEARGMASEFFGVESRAQGHWQRIKARQGLARFGAFADS